MENNQKKSESSLKVVTVFAKYQTVFGLPSHVFGMGILISIIIFFLLSKVVGILFGILFFSVMFSIHETDPKGFDVWRVLLSRHTSGWSAGQVNSTKIVIFK